MRKHISLDECDTKARFYVNGSTVDRNGEVIPHSAHWHERFRGHPWVQDADAEGWSKELRSVVIRNLRIKLFREQHEAKYPTDISTLMPNGDWVAYARQQAEIFASAAKWRAENSAATSNGKKSTFRPLADVSRPAMQELLSASPNRGMHKTLTERSRRMTGDDT